jgi:organic hydroperoxide reductase OsmC/OhrA
MTFKANAYWKVGARGTVEGDPSAKAIEFSAPPEFRGENGAWSPEQLLTSPLGISEL